MKYLLDNNGNETKYKYQVTPQVNGKIRIHVEENRIVRNETGQPAFIRKQITFDRTFHIGDFCLMDDDYIGVILKIEKKGVLVCKDSHGQTIRARWYSLKRFIEMNYDFIF